LDADHPANGVPIPRLSTLSWPSVVTRSGVMPVTVLADRKNVLAAFMSRRSLNITSTNAPELSMARYRKLWGAVLGTVEGPHRRTADGVPHDKRTRLEQIPGRLRAG
jgi:hypothetical protein